MKVLWAAAPRTASEVVTALCEQDPEWHPKTVRTLLHRLVHKRALGFRKEGRAHLYRPLVTEAECAGAASESFLERVFGGSFRPMLAHFVQQRKFSAAEIRELQRLLNERR